MPPGPPPVQGGAAPQADGTPRPRPVYKPRKISCPNCGAGLEIKDEQSRMAVCGSCRSQLELSAEEIKVLGILQNGGAHLSLFDLELGDSFRHKKARFEVIGRIRLEEEESAPTRQYLLYNPRQGTRWLSEYDGHWDISRPCRAMPEGDPRELRKGDKLTTYDGRKWLLAGKGTYRTTYVDGALPWVANVGDTADYAELEAADGSGATYEVEYPLGAGGRRQEIEAGHGHLLSSEELRRATRKDVAAPAVERDDVLRRKADYAFAKRAVLVTLLVNALFFFLCGQSGKEVINQELPRAALATEAQTQPFAVAKDGSVLRIEWQGPLRGGWSSIRYNLAREADAASSEASAQNARPGSSRGMTKKIQYVKVAKAGTYRLQVTAKGAKAGAEGPGLRVRVIDGARRPSFMLLGLIASLVILVIVVIQHQSWRRSDDDDEEDD